MKSNFISKLVVLSIFALTLSCTKKESEAPSPAQGGNAAAPVAAGTQAPGGAPTGETPKTFPKQERSEVEASCKEHVKTTGQGDVEGCVKYILEHMEK